MALKTLRAYNGVFLDALNQHSGIPVAKDEAAKEYRDTGETIRKVDELEKQNTNPYTSFLDEQQFVIRSAMDFVCGESDDRKQWQDCRHGKVDLGGLKFPIVVIGRIDPSTDTHQSVVGNVPGIILQANYIESLVDGRVFKPLEIGWQIVLIGLWLWMLGYIAWRSHKRILVAFAVSLVAIFAFLSVVEVVVVLLFRRYTDALFPALFAAVIINFGQLVEAMGRDSNDGGSLASQRSASVASPRSGERIVGLSGHPDC